MDDCRYIADNLRGDDRREVLAASGRDPKGVLEDGMLDSVECRVFEIDGDLCGIYGVARTPQENLGLIWMVCTPAVERHALTFLRHSRSEMQSFHLHYPVLFNYVDARNELHVKWLKWVGCTFIKRHLHFGAECREFLEFIHV